MNNKGQNSSDSSMTSVVERNIHALLAKRKQEEEALSWQDKMAGMITQFAGSMKFVYLHLVVYGLWIAINLGWIPSIKKFDPTFVVLALEASVEAIFLSTFILITQNRMMSVADRRADLNLQINLLAEHEITRLVEMVQEIGKKVGIQSADSGDLEELKMDVAPERVLDKIQETEENANKGKF